MFINKTKKMFVPLLVLVITLHMVYAHTEQDFTDAEQLTNSKISCDKLTDSQFELMGDYYMEQMHPGEAHEMMDKMMGGEGSQNLKRMHTQMAKRFYCNENASGMMEMMPMMKNMMGGGMMNMMGNYSADYGYTSFWNILWLIFLTGVIVLIIWFIYKFTKKGEDSETPINILQKRYVRGEINKRQFEEIKKEIGGDNHGKR